MKNGLLILTLLLGSMNLAAQYKSQTQPQDVRTAIAAPTNMLFGFFSPEKFSMTHSFSSSFISGGGGSLLLNAYVNKMTYQFNDKLLLNLDLGIMNTPYNSYLKSNVAPQQFNNAQFFGGGELKYQASDKVNMSIGVYSMPYTYQRGYYLSPIFSERP